MKLAYHILPVSGYKVGINTEPSFGEVEDIENFFNDNLAIPFKATAEGDVSDAPAVMGEFKGKLMSKKRDAELNTLVVSIKNKEDVELLVRDNANNTNALAVVRALCIQDGKFVRKLVEKSIEEIKKNYTSEA